MAKLSLSAMATEADIAASRSSRSSIQSSAAAFQALVAFVVLGLAAAVVGSRVQIGSAWWWVALLGWIVPSTVLFLRMLVRIHATRQADIAHWAAVAAEDRSLLPYTAYRQSWIGHGRTDLSAVVMGGGTVIVDSTKVQLLDETNRELASSPVGDVTFDRVLIWFGRGISLKVGAGRRWYVQPLYEVFGSGRGRHETKVLCQALKEAKTAAR